MNNKYTWLLLACMTTGAAQAQRVSRAQLPAWAHPSRPVDRSDLRPKPGTAGEEKAAGDVVFSEDFANGTVGNNGFGAWTIDGIDGAIWRRSTTGPLGGYSNNAQKISSTTAANGFMIFDCDRSNSDTTTTPPTPIDVSLFQSRDGYLVSPALNLSATPIVHLTFQERARWCCSTFSACWVDVSTDGGANWPTRLAATQASLFANDDPGTYTFSVNLQNAIAANPANVKFRFGWEGSSSSSGMSHYFWQVDDVNIVESLGNDLVMENPAFNQYNPSTDLTDKAEFDIIPINEVHPLIMGSPVMNEGANTATNVSMQMTVNRVGAGIQFDQPATAASIPPGVLDNTLFLPYTPDAIGDYTLDLALTSDSVDAVPADNTAQRAWSVSNFTYAQDEGHRDAVITRNDGATPPHGLEFYSCNFFWLENPADLYAIQVAFANGGGNSEVGGEIDCTVLDSTFAELGSTPLWDITATSQLSSNGQAKFQNILFDQPLSLDGQQEVCACAHYYAGGLPRVAVAASGASLLGQSLFMQANATGSRFLELTSPMVRMSFDPNVGIAESDRQNGVGMGQNFPNPVLHGSTTIPYDLKNAANVTVEVHDLSGQLVASVRDGNQSAGTHRVALNTIGLNNGIYLYTLSAGDVRITKRMTVIN